MPGQVSQWAFQPVGSEAVYEASPSNQRSPTAREINQSTLLFDSPPMAIPVFQGYHSLKLPMNNHTNQICLSQSEEDEISVSSLRHGPSTPDCCCCCNSIHSHLGSANTQHSSHGACIDEWINRSASMSQTMSLSFNSRLDLNAAFPDVCEDAKRARHTVGKFRKNRRGWLPNQQITAQACDTAMQLVTPPRRNIDEPRQPSKRVILTPVEKRRQLPRSPSIIAASSIARKIEDLRVLLPLSSPESISCIDDQLTPSLSDCSVGSATIHRSDGARLAEGTPAPMIGLIPGIEEKNDDPSGMDALSVAVSGQRSVTRSGCGSMGRNPSSRNVSSAGVFVSDSESSYRIEYTTPSMSPTAISSKTVSDFSTSEIRRLQRRMKETNSSGCSNIIRNRRHLNSDLISEAFSDAFISACASSSTSDDVSAAMLDEIFGGHRNLFGTMLADQTSTTSAAAAAANAGGIPESQCFHSDCESPTNILQRSRRIRQSSANSSGVHRQFTGGSPVSTPLTDELLVKQTIHRPMAELQQPPQSWFEANQLRADIANQTVIRLPLSRTGNENVPQNIGSIHLTPASMLTLSSCSTHDVSPVGQASAAEQAELDESFASLKRKLFMDDTSDGATNVAIPVSRDDSSEYSLPCLGQSPGDGFDDCNASDEPSDDDDLTESIGSLRF